MTQNQQHPQNPQPPLIAIVGATEHTDFQTGESFYSLTLRSPLREHPVFVQVDVETARVVHQLVVELLSAAGVLSSTEPPQPQSSQQPQSSPQSTQQPLIDTPRGYEVPPATVAHVEELLQNLRVPHDESDYPQDYPDSPHDEPNDEPNDEPFPLPHVMPEPTVLRIKTAPPTDIPRAREQSPQPEIHFQQPRNESPLIRNKPHAQNNKTHNKPKRKPGLDSI